jgi:Putative zinc-finger
MKTVTKDTTRLPCTDWAQKLAARRQDDLSPVDRRALREHLALCGACNQVYAAYQTLEAGIRSVTMKRPIPEFSYEPFQPLRKPSADTSTLTVQTLLLLFLTTLSSFYVKISWSPLFQAVHAWILLALSRFPRRVAYASTDNRFLYVMRSDSGYFLWKHKRFRRSELFSNFPIRGSGMLFTGSGTALAAALDFCKYAVQA